MLGVDDRHRAPALLSVREDVQRQGRLARRLLAIDLDDPAPGHPAHSQRQIQAEASRRDDPRLNRLRRLAHPHNRALAIGLLDRGQGVVEGLLPIIA